MILDMELHCGYNTCTYNIMTISESARMTCKRFLETET